MKADVVHGDYCSLGRSDLLRLGLVGFDSEDLAGGGPRQDRIPQVLQDSGRNMGQDSLPLLCPARRSAGCVLGAGRLCAGGVPPARLCSISL